MCYRINFLLYFVSVHAVPPGLFFDYSLLSASGTEMVTGKLLCPSIYRRISNNIYTQVAKMDLADPFPYTVEVYV